MNCRFCKNSLSHVFVDLGEAPPSNSFLSEADLQKPEAWFPLKLYVCDKCWLVQVAEYKKAEEIFSSNYVYFSSYSTSWLAHAKRYVEAMMQRFDFDQNSLVIELASNDGYLLQYFKEKNIPVLGIEPTLSTAEVARGKGIESMTEFFGVNLANRLVADGRKADLLLGNNVLAHVPDLNDFVAGMQIVLKDSGVITMEFPHLYQLVKHKQFDTIYQEHFSYLSFTTVKTIFEKHGLVIFDVEEIPTHGGSLRIYVKHAGDLSKKVSERVGELLEKENAAGMTSLDYYTGFQDAVENIKKNFVDFLEKQKAGGKKVAGYGAAAKGNTLLNFCRVKNDLVAFVVDASPHKQGKYLPGSHIPVVNERELLTSRPDFILVLPWNIRDEIIDQLQYTRKWNCRFVIVIPTLQII
jgi:SAM-dependent methyltransferase